MPQDLLQNIATEIQLFNTLEQKENFLIVLLSLHGSSALKKPQTS